MAALILSILGALRSGLRTRADLTIENLALRQQLANLRRTSGRPRLRNCDRAFWVVLSRLWSRWADVLVVVKPDTVVRWHRAGFRLFWRWKSRSGSPSDGGISEETKRLIRQMADANVGWGAPRIHGELLKLGIDIGERSVSRFMPPKPRTPHSQTWRTFLDNHVGSLASIDFFTVPTATFRVLYVFFVLAHGRRRVLHFNVTEHPTAAWTSQQIVEAFADRDAPRYLIRDRDSIYGDDVRLRMSSMGIEEVLTAPQSPWQNPYVERLIGSIRRDCLNHFVILNARHLKRTLASYFAYYHGSRTHLGLDKQCPFPRRVSSMGRIIEIPQLGGLHHRYERIAA